MKRITLFTIAFAGAISVSTALTAAASPPGYGRASGRCVLRAQNSMNLETDAARELIRMREEEKLARDVYLALHKVWGDRTFRISRSEQRHMDALARAIDRYGLEDPVVDATPGAFTDPVFGALYEGLVAAGSTSLEDAMQVGALIEELDIADLREAIDTTRRPDLTRLYQNLMRASRNHLRAYASRITAAGGTYEARHLPQEEFDAIAASPVEPGRGRRSGQALRSGDGDGRGWANGRGRGRRSGQGLRTGDGSGRGLANGQRACCGCCDCTGRVSGKGIARRAARGAPENALQGPGRRGRWANRFD